MQMIHPQRPSLIFTFVLGAQLLLAELITFVSDHTHVSDHIYRCYYTQGWLKIALNYPTSSKSAADRCNPVPREQIHQEPVTPPVIAAAQKKHQIVWNFILTQNVVVLVTAVALRGLEVYLEPSSDLLQTLRVQTDL